MIFDLHSKTYADIYIKNFTIVGDKLQKENMKCNLNFNYYLFKNEYRMYKYILLKTQEQNKTKIQPRC